MQAYKDTINATSTKNAPWHVIPADSKWYARLAVSEFIIETLKQINPQYPTLSQEESDKLQEYKRLLLEE